jgi:hypothetical protein
MSTRSAPTGLTIRRGNEARNRRLAATDKAAEIGPVGVALLCVKLWSLEEAGELGQNRRGAVRS